MAQDFTFYFVPKPKPRWTLFIGSYAGQAVMLMALANLAFRSPVVEVRHTNLDHITFLQPQPLVRPAPRRAIAPPTPQLLRKIAPPVNTARIEVPPSAVEQTKPIPLPQ